MLPLSFAFFSLTATPAKAGASECRPTDATAFCDLRALETNVITQADVDTTAANLMTGAWVIQGNGTVRLPNGTYMPGDGISTGAPTVWVTEQSTLEIDAADVTLASHVYLCDDAALVVRNGSLRVPQTFPFQYWYWAADDSRIVLDNATLRVAENDLNTAAFYMAMRGSSALDATAGSGGLMVQNGAWNLVTADRASAQIRDGELLGELYVASQASLTVERTEHISVFVNPCDVQTTVADLPPACDLTTTCFQPTHPETDYVRKGDPAVMLTDSRVFAWGIETLPGADVTLSNVDPLAQAIVLLNEMTGNATLTLPLGANPTGLSDRSVTVGTEPILAWHLHATDGADLTVGAGSVLGDIDVAGGKPSRVTVEGAEVRFGRVRVSEEGTIRFVDTDVDATVELVDGSLFATDATFTQPWTLFDEAWVANTELPDDVSLMGPDGTLSEVSITAPAEGTTFKPGASIEVTGTIQTSQGGVSGSLELYGDNGAQVASTTISQEVVDDTLTIWPTDFLPASGTYEMRLAFNGVEEAIATRSIEVLVDPPKTTPDPGNETSDGDDPSDPEVMSPGNPRACSCDSGGPALPTLAMLGVIILLRRRSGSRSPGSAHQR